MSDAVIFENGEAWFADGWAYRAIILSIAAAASNQELREQLLPIARDVPHDRLIDLRDLTDDQVKEFWISAELAFEQAKKRGPTDWYDASFFPGWLDKFAALLAAKPRQNG